MSAIEIHGGSFPFKKASLMSGAFHFSWATYGLSEKVPGSECVSAGGMTDVQIATEENVKKMAGAIGLGVTAGLVGGVLTGGLGLLVGGVAGTMAGGRKKKITFIVSFDDGKQFIGTSDIKTYRKIAGIALTNKEPIVRVIDSSQTIAKKSTPKQEFVGFVVMIAFLFVIIGIPIIAWLVWITVTFVWWFSLILWLATIIFIYYVCGFIKKH